MTAFAQAQGVCFHMAERCRQVVLCDQGKNFTLEVKLLQYAIAENCLHCDVPAPRQQLTPARARAL
jgi:hypothetical protein